MAYTKKTFSNNAECGLFAPITDTTTSILLSGNYDRLPTADFVVEVATFNSLNQVTVRENMYVTTRVNDLIVVTRAYEPVPIDFEATENITQSLPFAVSGTVVTQVISKRFLEEIQDETITKLGKGSLRTTLANTWKMFFSNGSNNETELSFGANGTYLKSNGASSAPEWSNPPLDINGQTESTEPASSWFVPLWTGSVNVKTSLANLYKGLSSATTSAKGIVQTATSAEATTLLNTTKYITPELLGAFGSIASDTLQQSADTETILAIAEGTDVKKKEIEIADIVKGGTIRVTYEGRRQVDGSAGSGIFELRKNGVVVQTDTSASTSYLPYSYDIDIVDGDLIQLYLSITSGGYAVYARNFRISFDGVFSKRTVVNLD